MKKISSILIVVGAILVLSALFLEGVIGTNISLILAFSGMPILLVGFFLDNKHKKHETYLRRLAFELSLALGNESAHVELWQMVAGSIGNEVDLTMEDGKPSFYGPDRVEMRILYREVAGNAFHHRDSTGPILTVLKNTKN